MPQWNDQRFAGSVFWTFSGADRKTQARVQRLPTGRYYWDVYRLMVGAAETLASGEEGSLGDAQRAARRVFWKAWRAG